MSSKFKYINGGFCVFVVPSAMYIDAGFVLMLEVTESGLSGNTTLIASFQKFLQKVPRLATCTANSLPLASSLVCSIQLVPCLFNIVHTSMGYKISQGVHLGVLYILRIFCTGVQNTPEYYVREYQEKQVSNIL